MRGQLEWLGPGRHGQQGGQSHQLWTQAQPQRLGPDLDFLSGQGHTPRLWAYRELLGLLTLQEAPGSFGKGSGIFLALCSVLPSVLTCVGGLVMVRGNLSSSFVHLMKLTSPISGAPFGLDLLNSLTLMVTTQTFIFLNFPWKV